MPEDERPPPAADLSGNDWHRLLGEGEVELLGRMPWSSNATFLVSLQLGELAGRAVYKPGAGERALWDFPPPIYRREVAAYRLARATGLEVVPDTVLRDGPLGEGSLQRFVDADFSEHYFTLLEAPDHLDKLRRIAAFDLLANNADRKGGHFLLDAEGAIWGIDNGLCFHAEPKLRTVAWEFAGEALPDEMIDACSAIAEEVPPALAAVLERAEVAALRRRAARLLERPVYPAPDLDDRCYPWPLV